MRKPGKQTSATVVHPTQPRMDQRGQVVQLDASPHDWLEESRGKRGTMPSLVDDATSEVLYWMLAEAETTQAYMELVGCYIRRRGRPLVLHADWHSVYASVVRGSVKGAGSRARVARRNSQ